MTARSRPVPMDTVLEKHIMQHYHMEGLKDSFGVEVEVEGKYIQTNDDKVMCFWKGVKDNSLRIKPGVVGAQAWEYVFNGPHDLPDTKKALKLLFDYLNKTEGVEVFDSYRTSIHVHVNCMQENIRTVVNFITLAMIFDELFVSQNGQTRIGNNFCLRTRDAEGQINDLINSITQYGMPWSAISPNNRYSSVNVASLSKYGTLEFRSLECTTNYERVMHWINTLQALKEAARKYENPKEIISTFSQKGPLAFTIHNLGDQHKKYVAVEGYHQMLHHGMRLAQDLAYCSDWRLPGKDDPKPRKIPPYKPKAWVINPVPAPWPYPQPGAPQLYDDYVNAMEAPQAAAPQPIGLQAYMANHDPFEVAQWGNNAALEVLVPPEPAYNIHDDDDDDDHYHNEDDLDEI